MRSESTPATCFLPIIIDTDTNYILVKMPDKIYKIVYID